ncbi:MAG: type II toxin-antitoxin system PemK/MazF family toxin [Dermatophilaceae bacterium]
MRGDIYRLRAAKNARGHEQMGMRYAVELQGPITLSTVIVAPTSTRAAPAVFRPDIDMDGTTTKVLVDQLAAVDGALRLGDMVGRLSAREMGEVDLALRLLLGLL